MGREIEKSHFTVETSDNHYSLQEVKVNINSGKSHVQFGIRMHFTSVILLFFFFFCFLRLHPRHMQASRLGVKSELQLPAYPTATATQDPSHV